MNLTDSTFDAKNGVLWQNPQSGFEPRNLRRQTRHDSVFFYVISMAGRMGRESGPFPLVRCSKPVLPSHQPSNFGDGFKSKPKEKDMTNLSNKTPIRDAVLELDTVEYDLRRAVKALINLSMVYEDIPSDIHFLIDRVSEYSQEVTKNYEVLELASREGGKYE